MTVFWGFDSVIVAVLVARNRPGLYVRPALVAIALTLILAFILIPEHGALGAALTTVPAAASLSLMTISSTVRLVGPVSAIRVMGAPLLAGGALALLAVALAGAPWLLSALLALGVYAAVFAGAERALHPADFRHYARIAGMARAGPAAADGRATG